MELTLEDDIETTRNLTEHQTIPQTAARPVVRIWSIETTYQYLAQVKESLFDLLPIYWSSTGIVDCKILEDTSQHNFIIIESWRCKELQFQFEQSASWQQAMKEFTAQRHITLKEITNNIFELIE